MAARSGVKYLYALPQKAGMSKALTFLELSPNNGVGSIVGREFRSTSGATIRWWLMSLMPNNLGHPAYEACPPGLLIAGASLSPGLLKSAGTGSGMAWHLGCSL